MNLMFIINTLFKSPKPRLLMACCFHSGRGGWKVMEPDLRTPNGTVTTTASALNELVQPDSVETACTSAPGGRG